MPYTIHTVLTDNGTQFVDTTPRNPKSRPRPRRSGPRARSRAYLVHAFAHACEQHGIEHRLTKPRHPWTNGQVERMNRTLKDATVERYHYGSHDELRHHLQLFVDAYNYGRRLKTLRGLTPYEFVCKVWTEAASSVQARPVTPHPKRQSEQGPSMHPS